MSSGLGFLGGFAMTAPTFEELVAEFKKLPFSGHAHAIGLVCITWNNLENSLNVALAVFSGLAGQKTAAAILNNADMRDKWKMHDAVGILVKPSDEWYDRLKEVINRSDNELRNERNRMVHDQWSEAQTEIIRRTSMAKIVREQARQFALKTHDSRTVTEDDIWHLVIAIVAQSGYLAELVVEYLNSQIETGEPSPEK